MGLWTLGYEELSEMNWHDRRKIIFHAMKLAKLTSQTKPKWFITLTIVVTIVLAICLALLSTPALLIFIGVFIISGLFWMTVFIYYMKAEYEAFIVPSLIKKEAILGTPEQRLKDERMRSFAIILNVILVSGTLILLTL